LHHNPFFMHLNVEIKAICRNQAPIREWLKSQSAEFRGTDHQKDTYFNVTSGRMKLRQGNIENALIHYDRENNTGPKSSNVSLYKTTDGDTLCSLLTKALGVKTIVEKSREIYFINNVKFHLDSVPNLGEFVEIEAIDTDGTIGRQKLQEQCDYYISVFRIRDEDMLTHSYSDMISNY